jgi:hypothetical protein
MKQNVFKYVTDGTSAKDASSVDQMFGIRKVLNLPYQTSAQLESALKGMNLADIQKLAVTFGIKPASHRPQLVRACIDQFNRLTKTYGAAKEQTSEVLPTFDPSKF